MRFCPASTAHSRAEKTGPLQRGFPHLAPLLHHSLRGGLLSYHSPGTPVAAKRWRQAPAQGVPASLSLSRGGCQHAPRRSLGSPLSSMDTPQALCTPGFVTVWQGHTHHSSAEACSHHHEKGELGPAAFSQIQRFRSSGPAHWAGLMFPRLIMAQDPFDFDCHGLDGERTHQGVTTTLATIPCQGSHSC